MKHRFGWAALAGLLAISSVGAKEPLRLDASTDATAEASWKAMHEEASPEQKQKLALAMLKINLAGTHSAHDAARDPALQTLGITGIKDKVSGMTAEEIIALADRVSTITAEPARD
ncbi:hypothetical protein [Pseudoxanthomonas sp. PXM01]|uniref:hypothetical protein n=1 Tax=Pseudoxanthomonas sp. PXM01 TaxID=2769295 RepID=UPI00177CAEC2|nr:hypothetical protein [Pseudoxanthomonas sp. PXM01]MBD9470868.1 hypothetical protein [Pseudoxanthomonas sp. PXM01]